MRRWLWVARQHMYQVSQSEPHLNRCIRHHHRAIITVGVDVGAVNACQCWLLLCAVREHRD